MKYKIDPWPYQKDVIANGSSILEKTKMLALLMEMRLGKTKCIVHIAEELKDKNLVNALLIIAPKALLSVWNDEPTKHSFLKYESLVWEATRVTTKTYQKEIASFLYSKEFKILVVNIEAFQNKNESLNKLLSGFIANQKVLAILDESTKIKNHSANRTKNLLKLTDKIPYKAILTGTEVTETLLDLYTQFLFLNPRFWPYKNFFVFRAHYAVMKDIRTNTHTFKKVVGFKLVDELMGKISPYCIRLKKVDVFKDLPEQIEQEIKIDMNKEQRKVYDELKKQLWVEYKNNLLTVKNKISLFTRFRQICSGFFPETGELIGESNEKLKTILEDCETYNDQIVIVSCFSADIAYIERELKGIYGDEAVVVFTGAQTKQEKENNLKSFQTDKKVKFFILNPKTGSYGIDLQNASLVYYFNRSLSIEENIQGQARVHGPLQKQNVFYKDIIMNNSIDEKILKLLKQKKDLIQSFQNLSIEDCFDLI